MANRTGNSRPTRSLIEEMATQGFEYVDYEHYGLSSGRPQFRIVLMVRLPLHDLSREGVAMH